MHYIFDKVKIKQAISDFYISTGIAIALYDATETLVAAEPGYTGFCACIRQRSECAENCDKSNLRQMKAVFHKRGTLSHTCHAGLMETMMPILYEDVIIAYMQIGQYRDADEIFSSRENIYDTARHYGFPAELLLAQYETLPVISAEKLQSLLNILSILIKSFWVDGLILRNRSMISVKIEQYITEHLTEKIYIAELCDTFSLSKNALYDLFRTEFGTTVNEFILDKRLSLAQQLLLSQNNRNVTDVSSICGFSDYNYFIRIFKKRIGSTPLQFRKNHFSKEQLSD